MTRRCDGDSKALRCFGVRMLILGVLALGLLACVQADEEDHPAEPTLTVVTYGGAWGEAVRQAFVEPFEEAHGVEVNEVSWAGDFGRLRAMVETGNVDWDVVDVEAFMVPLGTRENLLEPIDYSLIPKQELLKDGVRTHGVATCFWSTVLAFSEMSAGRRPTNWEDFWNLSDFPGARSLRRDPTGNLELALLAAGVPPADLYPLDVDRSFQKLTEIRDEVAVWWEAGEQPARLLSLEEVDFSTAWNGRIHSAMEAGKRIGFTWNQGLVSSDWWVIPRGTKNLELAQKFIAYASGATAQAEFPKYIPYGPVNQIALDSIPAELLVTLPTAPQNLEKQVVIDQDWWLENRERVLERWNRWLLE